MKAKRDFSMLYGALAGFFLFACLFGFWIWSDETPDPDIPAGSRHWEVDTMEGFPVYGIEMDIYLIPEDRAEEFAKQLLEIGFEPPPLPSALQETLAFDSDTSMLSEVSHGLWWFENHDPEGGKTPYGHYTNFHLKLYDMESCAYYNLRYVF